MLRPLMQLVLLSVCAALAGCAQSPGISATQANTVETGTRTGDISAPRNRARVHTELAAAYFERGNIGVALEELRIAIDADPTYAPAFNVFGLVHMELREAAVAQQHFETALRLSPNDPDINNNFGWFLCQNGRAEQSIAYFLAALKNPLYQTPARSYVNAGLCALKNQNERDAFDYFQRALRSEPDNVQALLSLAAIQYRHGQLASARDFIGRVHRLTEASAASLWLALRIERKLGDTSAENTYATQLRRRFIDSPEYQDMLRGKFE